jgi:hypothetical protein
MVKKSTDTGLFCGVIPADLAKNPELLKRVNTMSMKTGMSRHTTKTKNGFGSEHVCWDVIQIFDNEVPKRILEALYKESKAPESDCSVYTLMWGDLLFFRGEDGWCLSDKTLKVVESWLELRRKQHRLGEQSAFWFRIKRA